MGTCRKLVLRTLGFEERCKSQEGNGSEMHRHLSLITSMHLQYGQLCKADGKIQVLYGGLSGRNLVMKRSGDLPGAGAGAFSLSLNH